MKKILCSCILLFMVIFAQKASAEYLEVVKVEEMQKRIDAVGFKILNENNIEYRVVFDLCVKNHKNASTSLNDRTVTVYKGLYTRLSTDDELAGILSHEIAHAVDSYQGIFRGTMAYLPMSLSPKKYEYKADKKAVDYMVTAGYNPVAYIVALNKIVPQTSYDIFSSHPLTSRRMIEVYEYIYRKYPQYLANNAYKNNLVYQNFLLTSKKNREIFRRKIESNSRYSKKYL